MVRHEKMKPKYTNIRLKKKLTAESMKVKTKNIYVEQSLYANVIVSLHHEKEK